MKKLIPPHPPLEKGGMGGFESHPHPPYRQAGIQREGIHLELGSRLLLLPGPKTHALAGAPSALTAL